MWCLSSTCTHVHIAKGITYCSNQSNGARHISVVMCLHPAANWPSVANQIVAGAPQQRRTCKTILQKAEHLHMANCQLVCVLVGSQCGATSLKKKDFLKFFHDISQLRRPCGDPAQSAGAANRRRRGGLQGGGGLQRGGGVQSVQDLKSRLPSLMVQNTEVPPALVCPITQTTQRDSMAMTGSLT